MVCWLLGSATGEAENLEAIHGPRLERLLEKLVDTPVRGFVYEAAGTVPDEHLALGRRSVERAAQTWQIPVAFIDEPRDAPGWAHTTALLTDRLLAGG